MCHDISAAFFLFFFFFVLVVLQCVLEPAQCLDPLLVSSALTGSQREVGLMHMSTRMLILRSTTVDHLKA